MTETDKQQNKESGKIRIKDVARLAGVSVGTVDRVLHGRPNVSSAAKEKVEKALKEMDYQLGSLLGGNRRGSHGGLCASKRL